MKAFLKHNIVYIFFYLVILILLANILLTIGKVQIHQRINVFVGHKFVDVFFKYITYLGDGLFAIGIVIWLLFRNVKSAIYVFGSYIFASLFTTLLKNIVFDGNWRPSFVFQWYVNEPLKLVEGVLINAGDNSLPSGHATSAFAVFFSLIFMSKNHLYKCIFFALAILAAFSRTYLSQHWLVDVYFGSIVGFCFALLFYVVFYRKSYSNYFDSSLQLLISNNKKRV